MITGIATGVQSLESRLGDTMVTIRLRPHHLPAIEDNIYNPAAEMAEGLRNCDYSSEYIKNERSTIWKILTEREIAWLK